MSRGTARNRGAPWNSTTPIRDELFGAERLEAHARSLAAAHGTGRRGAGRPLSRRLADNATLLQEAYRDTVEALDEGAAITPAAEWLIDNFHLIEKQIREIRLDLPPGYYRELPKIAAGHLAGYPRVVGVAWAFVAHTDSHFDCDLLCRFLRAYQEEQPLTIGELWAVAITLRLVLVENLRRIAEAIVISRSERTEADRCCNRVLGAGGQDREPVAAAFSNYCNRPLPDAFIVQAYQRLSDADEAMAPALSWLDEALAGQGLTAEGVIRLEQQRQVAASATVRNIITSMRLISDVDWAELVERVSMVDDVLRAGSAFADMDFPTRNLYRDAIEELARGSDLSQLDIARAAVKASRAADDAGGESHRRCPGHYLVGNGRAAFERSIGFRSSPRAWPARLVRSLGIGAYVGAILALTGLLLAPALAILWMLGTGGGWLAALGLLGAVPALDLSVALVNRGVTDGFRATPLPALELKGGIPQRLRTVVAVPVLLTNVQDIETHIERLEIHYLSSPQGHLHFALLSDWLDAASENVPGDAALLAAATEGIRRLNQKHGAAAGGDRFLLFHRRRVWSESERCWMGWERKRGKLHELNRLLRGAADTTFLPLESQTGPQGVRYVLTLDADTRLPRDTVRRLIGKMAHPLNRPRFDPLVRRVVEGYAILQPRITPALPMAGEGSVFRRVFSSMGGIDPYAAAVSDVYQDLFGEGSFAGKGIYEIDAFEAAMKDRAPEAALLSHDLFEGVFARAGLASDVEVVEDFPDRYDVSAIRHHRWARGDWQLLPWILGVAPAPRPAPAGRLPAIGRWKMVDNLRRTLSPGASLASLWAGWLLPLPAAGVWTAFMLAAFIVPHLIPAAVSFARRRPGVPLRARLHSLEDDLGLALLQAALVTVFLAHQTWLMGDAIARTLWRLMVSRRRLLQWVPAAQAAAGLRFDQPTFFRRMAAAPGIGLATLALSWGAGGSWVLAGPFALLWIASPGIAFLVSRPTVVRRAATTAAEVKRLRLTARRTWRFFETFVTASDNMLPPDNFQEEPEAVAHRTSPTNIGLYLLSAVAARDLGWIGTVEATERIEATLATMGRMERCRGHFFNWYDTRDLRPLDPRYISSVDSGNLAGHLLALANALEEWTRRPVSPASHMRGAADALHIARGHADALRGAGVPDAIWGWLDEALVSLAQDLSEAAETGAVTASRLAAMTALAERLVDAAEALAIEQDGHAGQDLVFWTRAVERTIASHRRDLEPDGEIARRLTPCAATARRLALEMEFGFLLHPDRMLLSIGYRAVEGELDPTCYDLLGSEARLASFVAIAKGDAPPRHWFRLSHTVTPVAHGAALVSWSGSMFEYLMPSLVMRAPPGSLLAQTNRLVVHRQIDYAASLRVPWGMSESAYNARDLELTYQYLSFGVPSLGLKRGLADHVVIAPYATALAAMVDAPAAARNFEQLEGLGACGRHGFYEALDYTPERVPDGQRYAIVRAFMAHHQGMTIVAIANALSESDMRARFHAEPMMQATELLLEERMPREVVISQPVTRRPSAIRLEAVDAPGARRISDPHTQTPATQLLTNGSYSVMLTASGSGYSRWQDMAVTRWREDATRDDFGSYIFLRDVHSGAVWSAGHQPIGAEPDSYQATFTEDRCEIVRRDGAVTTTLDVLVSPEDDGEVRRVSVTNSGMSVREIELTSYAEIVLAPQSADVAHPAFSKLFVETEHLPALGALLATRRRRSRTEREVWAAHLAVVEGGTVGKPEFDTDRTQVLGRGRDVHAPLRILDGRPLSGSVGMVLDPVFALRRRVRILPGATVRVSFWTLTAPTRRALLDLVDKHHDPTAFDRAADLAWTQAQVQLHHLGMDRGEAALFQRLASHLIYTVPELRPPSSVIEQGAGGQPGLWRVGISGDLPIVLLRISDSHDLSVARQLIRASDYWRSKQLDFDLVLLNERRSSYVQDLQAALEALVRAGQSRGPFGENRVAGRTVVLRADMIPEETCGLLASVARIVLIAQAGTLSEQLGRTVDLRTPPPPPARRAGIRTPGPPPIALDLEFFNGLGGFVDDGREYVTVLAPGQVTPAPWINIVANPRFGFQASADGAGFSWRVNSRERQLTPWSNDPVADPSGEALFIRDEDSGDLWSPTASPIREEAAFYIARHGRGYCRFEHSSREIDLELTQFVPISDPVKISRLKVRNASARKRRLSVTGYAEWVLGPSRAAAAPFTITSIDPLSKALFAQNRWNPAFGAPTAFADLNGRQTSWTGDRREFIGRNGRLASPAGLAAGVTLSNTVGAGLDPCAALQTTVELAPGESCEIVFLLGEADSETEARAVIARYRAADLDTVLADIGRQWDGLLGAVQVKTPDRSMDVMLNGWLLYQTVACRLWARSAFYQASGAYGFRDQLQDSMALAAIEPSLTREHLLRAAGRQFVEGDVQHWWLPHSGQGVRTRISDDRVWLAYAAAHYVETADDAGVLDEIAPFLAGDPLEAGEAERFFQPLVAEEASLYEHCARALDASLELGGHGLPLIGGGDWNDGMNRVGERGLGESVWLGWLLHRTLAAFVPFAEMRDDRARVRAWKTHMAVLQASLERNGWDGDWYRRGWFDDGAPLGSSASEECRIDSIAQSWAVLSGVAMPGRAAQAMAAVRRELVLDEEQLALLFTPPFDRTPLDPGYIKAYPPGIRENGGQYTHAAAWSVMAFAALGQGDQAVALFSLLNPINHARSRSAIHRYKVEPYVMAGDVYAAPAHIGRGGWTWYTGSAAWMQRAGVESILGLRRQGAFLIVDPCIPADWPGFTATIRHGASRYEIIVENPDRAAGRVRSSDLDGLAITERPPRIELVDDGNSHRLTVILEAAASPPPSRTAQ